MVKKLSDQQELFCREYLIDLNQTQAAIRAGYSENSARSTASRLLTYDNIQSRIQELFNERSERVEIQADWVLTGIKDLTDRLVKSDTPAQAYKGYELAGKHLKLFTEKVEQDTNIEIKEIKRVIV